MTSFRLSVSLVLFLVASPMRAQTVDFNRDIRPLLSDRCFTCHGPDEATRQAELRLDDADALAADKRPIIVGGQSAASLLVQRITSQDPDQVMPPADSGRSLNDRERDLLKRWIEQGARYETHWAYRHPARGMPATSSANPIDGFIRDRSTAHGLVPATQADRVTLIRRLSFDLIGLPPEWDAVRQFVNDDRPDAYERLVDELLSSPHFGERLAMYWLDVVRFADSNGYHSDEPRQLGPYREYVIRSFNRNLPYDQFIIEQLAGDLLPDATMEQHVASGFNMLLQTTTEGGAQAKEYIAKYAADRVRNTSQIFIGSTMGCCECHNHKFDPFTTKDFYSFAAFFADIDQPALANPASYPVTTDADRLKLADFDQRIAAIRQALTTLTPELEIAQREWERTLRAEHDSTPKQSDWSTIGPFSADSFDAAHATEFVDPSDIRTDESVGDKSWTVASFADGTVHAFDPADDSARYLTRTLTVEQERELFLMLGSDDAITVWMNGDKVHDNKTGRAAAADQDRVRVTLRPGENRLLLKITNGAGGFGFYYRAESTALPDSVKSILQLAEGDRTDAQRSELTAYFLSVTPVLLPARDQLAKVEADRAAFEAALPRTLMTKSTTPREVKLLNRGNWMDDSGPVMTPAVPEFLGRLDTGDRRATRLDLARWIASRDNPLTARTMVNRLWKLYFGQGLATPLDDLGRQGVLPSHPELLDWLSVEFMDSGWDLKHMIRLMVTSETYRQSAVVSDETRAQDPTNKWYARQQRQRLDAELVRDNALEISGLLNRSIGGPSVYPYQPAGYWRHLNFPVREWPGDSGDDLYRRGLYTWWQRMFMHPSLKAFDAPSREECTVERPRSNIPQQALVLLNDPIYVEAARAFAVRMLQEGGPADHDRLNWAFHAAVSRDVTSDEVAVLLRVRDEHRAAYGVDPASATQLLSVGEFRATADLPAQDVAAWTGVARVILNLSETITRP